jgi:thiol-disulfide isomerase/thioredoxin
LFFCSFAFASDAPELILFYWETCPHCKNEERYLEELKSDYEFEVVWYEVFFNSDNQKLMEVYSKKVWKDFTWVPVIIMDNDYVEWEDYDETRALLEKHAIKKSELNTEPDVKPIDNPTVRPESPTVTTWEIEVEVTSFDKDNQWTWADATTWTDVMTWDENMTLISWDDQTVKFLWKEISMRSVWPIVFWIILWFVDGINPCMFWVLIFLLTYLVSVGSKKKVLYSGLIFVITTFVLYFGIMYLMHNLIFSTMAVLPYIAYIKYAIGIIAIILWAIEIKDYFWYGQWISLKIPTAIKPTLEYITKKWTYMSAFVLAVLSTFVELPCTIWIPLAYVWAVWDNINVFLALWIYNFFFIIPLLFIVFWIYFWLSAFKSDENGQMAINDVSSKKIMRLIAGIVLIVLWALFLFKVI